MALKDWKKIKENKREIIWGLKKYPQVIVQIYRTPAYVLENKWNSYGSAGSREFKTKSQALKYVKAYMRTH